MTELVIVDNPDLGIAVLVDIDEFRPLPFVAAGENREAMLLSFRDSVPFDVTIMDDATLRTAFGQFLESVADAITEAPEAPTGEVESSGGNGDDAQIASAEREAAEYGVDPAPAPADTDQSVGGTVGLVRVRCWNCNGTGAVDFGEDQAPQQCNMCQGAGTVAVEPAT